MLRSPINLGGEQISLGICPGQIGVVRRKAGLFNIRNSRKQPPQQGIINVPDAVNSEAWQPALETIKSWIDEYAIKNASATLTLSNRFARFALVPWSSQVTRSAEEAALARARCESQYGDMAGWTIQLDPGSYGVARIACALETSLLENLRHLFAAQRIRCQTVQPYFVAGWNKWRRGCGQRDALFAIAESQTVVMAAVKGGQWHSVRNVHGKTDASSLQILLEREALLQGFAEMPQIRIHAPSLSSADVTAWPESMRLLESGVIVSDAALTMALLGDAA